MGTKVTKSIVKQKIKLKNKQLFWICYLKMLPLHRFSRNRWQDAEFPVMLRWNDKQI